MKRRRIVMACAAAGAAIGGAAALVAQHRRFRISTNADARTVFSDARRTLGAEDLKGRWDRLPPPIQRHLQYSIQPNAPSIRTARLRHAGTFRTGPDQR